MNILAVADNVDPRVYSRNIKERFSDINCVLGAGDLDISYYEYILTCLNKPLYFVFGNHNLKSLSFFKPSSDGSAPHSVWGEKPPAGYGSVCVDGRVILDRKLGLIIAGLGGSRNYNKGEHQFSEFQMLLRALGLFPGMLIHRIIRGRWLDILLTHATPAGIHDREDPCHKGFKVFLWFMRRFKPRYLIHGHVHLYDINAKRSTKFGGTTILNAYDHIVVNWEKGMRNNSFVASQAEADFVKAKQRAWIDSLKGIVNPEAGQLLSFHDVKDLLKPGK